MAAISQVGFSHKNILRSIVHHACMRFRNLAPVSVISDQVPSRLKSSELNKSFPLREGAQKVFVIFGGNTSERQVSLMSGTNVWLNLLAFNDVSVHKRFMCNQRSVDEFCKLMAFATSKD